MDASKIILLKDLEEAEKEAKKKQHAINKASALIEDAKARYIKEKTRARSKAAALEKDAALKSAKFNCLLEYERFDDIQEAYGYDMITEKERDRLEDLWREREEILNSRDDEGYYKDLVTDALREAYLRIQDLWQDEIEKAYVMKKEFDKQRIEAEEEFRASVEAEKKAMREMEKHG